MSVWVLSKKRERMGERENIDVWSILKLCRVFPRVLAAKNVIPWHGGKYCGMKLYRRSFLQHCELCRKLCIMVITNLLGVTIEFLYNLTIESCSSWFCQPPSIPSATLLSCSEYSLMLCPLSSFFVDFFRFFVDGFSVLPRLGMLQVQAFDRLQVAWPSVFCRISIGAPKTLKIRF